MVYTITFNPALDYVMNLESLRIDDINRTVSEKLYYGGKGINVSVILSRLGIDNTALGFLAGFTGRRLEEMLVNDGINCNFNYLKDGYTRINVKIKADTEIDVNANGPDIKVSDIEVLMSKLDEIKEGDYLVFSGSTPKSLPDDTYRHIMERLSRRGVRFVVDAEKDLLLNSLKYKPFLIKPNHHELGDIFNVKINSDEDIIKYAKVLQGQGAVNVLVSMAENGAMLIDEYSKVHKIENAPGRVVNSVGCGDSMVAGFIAGCIEKSNYEYALKLGTACGNATAFSKELAFYDEINAVFNKYYSS